MKANDTKGLTRRQVTKAGLILALSGTATTLSAPPVVGRTQPKILRVGHIESPESATHRGFERLGQLVEEKSSGSVQVRIHPAGQLGGLRDLYEGIRFGSLDITSSAPDHTANLVPLLALGVLYYVWTDADHAARVLDGPVGEQFDQALVAGAGLKILAWGDLGMRHVFNNVRPIETPEDLTGMRVRVPAVQIHLLPMEALGASPTPLAYAEVYTAMQTGAVDAAEAVPAVMFQQRFNEVSRYFSLTSHLYNPIHVVIGQDSFSRLEEAEQTALSESAREAFQWQRETSVSENDEAVARLETSTVSVNRPTIEPFRRLVEPTWAQFADPLGAEGQEILKAIQAAA